MPAPARPPWTAFARAPLVPVGLAAGAGLCLDRYVPLAPLTYTLAAIGCLVGWAVVRGRSKIAAGWLWACAGFLAALHHHNAHVFAADDVSLSATPTPTPVRLRGSLAEEPVGHRPPAADPLVALPKSATTTTVLAVDALDADRGWVPASGRCRLTVEGELPGLHRGDVVEVVGRLWLPSPPGNPGEVDYRQYLLDRGMTAEVRVEKSADGVTRLEEGWRASALGWLAVARGWGGRVLQQELPAPESGVAVALLLGDNAALDRDGWDAFARTGVIHVLAISGQHLVILAGFLWLGLRAAGVRRRHGAWAVAGLTLGYAVLTGGRPSAVRAAVMVAAVCGAIILRRPVVSANVFALAWLVVVVADPTDPFTAGCQLSFVSVFVLVWYVAPLLEPRERTPVEQLLDEARGPTAKWLRVLARFAWNLFVVSLILGVVNAPLTLAWQNLASPVGVLLGPPLVLLTSVALIAGFLLLLTAPLGPVAWPFARLTEWTLAACGWLVHQAERIPGGWAYGPAPAGWWLVGFYLGVGGVVLLGRPWRGKVLAAVAAWTAFGLALPTHRPDPAEMRVTILSVGHGGCAVIETPDGRVLLYDAGTTAGPDVVRRTVAPYLWGRGVGRIDEVFVSHADLDHFNGLIELGKRFPIGRVTLTPSFADKPTPGVAAVLADLDRRGIERRVAIAGDRFTAGAVTLDVLHPPRAGPDGPENVRSMVLLVRHAGHAVLLTGDLEGTGQVMARAIPIPQVDVLLAPHHGARGANAPGWDAAGKPAAGPMAAWARPRLVVSSQKPGRADHLKDAYGAVGATVWDTPTTGAVTLRSHATGLTAEAFRTGEVRVVRRGGGK